MSDGRSVYMVAVGGVGMSALAGLFRKAGWKVTGSDRALYPPVSEYLRELSIPVSLPYRRENVPEGCDAYVVGNAVTAENPEAERIREIGGRVYSLPSALYEFFLKDRKRLVVTGTHGKTTTSAMAAFALRGLGLSPSYFIGGIPVDLGKSSDLGEGEFFVVEGDEYDSAYFDKRAKFFHYRPHVLAITSLEFDHADIYGSIDDIKEAFKRLVWEMPRDGTVIAVVDYPEVRSVVEGAPCRVITVSKGKDASARVERIRSGPGEVRGRLVFQENDFEIVLGIPGEHNLMNAAVASLVLFASGVPVPDSLSALSRFGGVKRRQTLLGRACGVTVVDDFAHHPTAVVETIRGVREFYSPSRLIAVFEPRSNTSRRNLFEREYARALGAADVAVVAPPHMAERIPENERFDPERVSRMMRAGGKEAFAFADRDEIPGFLSETAREGDLLLFMSNGDFGGIQGKTLQLLKEKEGRRYD